MHTKTLKLLFAFLGLSLIINSCKKDEDKSSGGGGTTLPPVSQMSATINGVPWTSNSAGFDYFFVNNACTSSDGMAEGGMYQVAVSIEDQIVSGQTYPLGPFGGNVKARVEVIDTTGNIYMTDSPNGGGQLIVTSFDPATRSISLAFSCTLVEISNGNSLVISGGNFTYRPYLGPVQGNSYSAQLNGTAYPVCAGFGVNYPQDDQLALIGQSAAGDYIEIYLPNTVTSGTTLPLPGVAEIYASDGTLNLDNADVTGGSIVITSHNLSARRISGTFSAQGTDQSTGAPVSITQGAFNITYQDFLFVKPTDGIAERSSTSLWHQPKGLVRGLNR